MYWGDLDKIEMANLDGTGRRLLGRERIAHYFAFTFHAGNIYFTDWRRMYVFLFSAAVTAKLYDMFLMTIDKSIDDTSTQGHVQVQVQVPVQVDVQIQMPILNP